MMRSAVLEEEKDFTCVQKTQNGACCHCVGEAWAKIRQFSMSSISYYFDFFKDVTESQ